MLAELVALRLMTSYVAQGRYMLFKRLLLRCQRNSGRRLLGEKEAVVPCASNLSLYGCDFAMGTDARTLGDRRVYTGTRAGLHRHLALVMLAYSFLIYERMRTAQDHDEVTY